MVMIAADQSIPSAAPQLLSDLIVVRSRGPF